jgi:hypothetical protein
MSLGVRRADLIVSTSVREHEQHGWPGCELDQTRWQI